MTSTGPWLTCVLRSLGGSTHGRTTVTSACSSTKGGRRHKKKSSCSGNTHTVSQETDKGAVQPQMKKNVNFPLKQQMDSISGFWVVGRLTQSKAQTLCDSLPKHKRLPVFYPEAFLTPMFSVCLLCEVWVTFPQECCADCAFSPSCSLLLSSSYCYCKFQQSITWHAELCHVCVAWCSAERLYFSTVCCALRRWQRTWMQHHITEWKAG